MFFQKYFIANKFEKPFRYTKGDFMMNQKRYALRKLKVGLASVAVAFALGTARQAAADDTALAAQNSAAINQTSTASPSSETAASAPATQAAPTVQASANPTAAQAAPEQNASVVETQPAASTETVDVTVNPTSESAQPVAAASEVVSTENQISEATPAAEASNLPADTNLSTVTSDQPAAAVDKLKQDDTAPLADNKVETPATISTTGSKLSDISNLPIPGEETQPVVSGHGELTQKTAVTATTMDDANGATVSTPDNLAKLIVQGYNLDPTKDHITYAFAELEGLNQKLKANGDTRELYFNLAFDRRRDAVGGDKAIYVNLWDKTSNTLLETIVLAESRVNYTSKVLEDLTASGVAEAAGYVFSKADLDNGGQSSSNVFVYHSVKTSQIHTLYSLTEGTKIGVRESDAQFKDTVASIQNTYYVSKNPDGSVTQLAVWTNEGWAGSAFTSSGEREFKGYELVQSPTEDKMSGLIAVRPVVGYTWEDTKRGGNNSGDRWAQRIGEVVNDQSAIILKIISATNADMTENVQVEFTSDVIYPAGAVKPDGTISTGYATNGPAQMVVGKVTYDGGRYNYQNGSGALRGFKLQSSMFTPQPDAVYVYEPMGTVTVHYVDTEGNTLRADVIDTKDEPTGTAYDTTDNKPEKIQNDGVTYYLKEVADSNIVGGKTVYEVNDYTTADPEQGTVARSTYKNVTYVYEEGGSVIINYVLAGTENSANPVYLQATVKDEDYTKGGTAYDTTDHMPEIITSGGKTYKRVPALTIGNKQGTVESGKTKEVTYVYDEIKTGLVVVNYVDENGTPIKNPVTDTPETDVDTPYNTTDNKPDVIKTDDGKTYQLIKTEGTETGQVSEGETVVTYIYREVVTEVPNDYPTVELPEGHISIVPNDYPTYDLPELDLPMPDKPEVRVPETPEQPNQVPSVDLTSDPAPASKPASAKSVSEAPVQKAAALPETGDANNGPAAVGVAALMAAFGLGYVGKHSRSRKKM